MHNAWAIFASTEDYLSIFPHMTQLWHVTLTRLASTTTVVEVGDFKRITNHFRGTYRIYLK
jgi:hypothetical protein